ncbi:MAG: hypothetical protein RLN81_03045 [Balneolaceae bacterium]
MNTTLYYGEIVARISGKLYSINRANDYEVLLKKDMSFEDMLCDISADAGRVFDTFEDLSGEHFIDWRKALDHYADALCSFILSGRMPTMADMITMATKSMELSRAECLTNAKAVL